MANEIFVVRIAKNGTVNQDPVGLKKQEKQRLVWVSDADSDYTIEFIQDSPFGDNTKTFEVRSRRSCDPGLITAHLARGATKRCDYVVRESEKQIRSTTEAMVSADPTIIVQN